MTTKRFFAIGDIHGCLDELVLLIEKIESLREPGESIEIDFCGDYVDRGPDSKGVIQRLMQGPSNKNDTWRFVRGNHEDLFEGYLGHANFIMNGGDRTEASYGFEPAPKHHMEWVNKLPFMLVRENHVIVHGGLEPGVSLENQRQEVVTWIRDKFLRLKDTEWDGKHIIHGHTPKHSGKPAFSEPELLSWRTNLDTGCCFGGPLTAGEFQKDSPTGPTRVIRVFGDLPQITVENIKCN